MWTCLQYTLVLPVRVVAPWLGLCAACLIMIVGVAHYCSPSCSLVMLFHKPTDTSLFGKTDTQKPTAWLNRAADALTGKDAETASYSSIYATAEPSIQGSSFMYFGPTGVGLGPLQVDHTGAREPHHPAASDANAMFRLYEETVAILEKALGHPLPNRL